MSEPSWDEKTEVVRRRVEDALATGIQELRGGVVTKWVVVVEFMDEDGDRELASMSTADLMRWDVTGMLDYMLNGDHAQRIATYLNEEERP